jgi:peptidoglycan/xylan/chitin deacetylase (PgdA/CDA1 family)
VRSRKELLAGAMHTLRADMLLLACQRQLWSPFVRVVNYHDVPPNKAKAFERQLQFYRDRFESVDLQQLLRFLDGQWNPPRPGLILSFDDGFRSHAEIVAPLLERYGFTGWFMVPGGFVDARPEEQIEYARIHEIGHSQFDCEGSRLAMTWEELRHLSDRHVVGCHTWTHQRLRDGLAHHVLEVEIPGALQRLEERLGSPVRVFAWVGGEEWSYSRAAAVMVRQAGFCVSFMTNNHAVRPGCDSLHLQRTNIEAGDSDAVVGFQLSGAMDLLYMRKRLRVNRVTAIT